MTIEEAQFLTKIVNKNKGSYAFVKKDIENICYAGGNTLYKGYLSTYSIKKLRKNGFRVLQTSGEAKMAGLKYRICW